MEKNNILPIKNKHRPIIYAKYSGIDCGYFLEKNYHALADAEACAWIASEIL